MQLILDIKQNLRVVQSALYVSIIAVTVDMHTYKVILNSGAKLEVFQEQVKTRLLCMHI